MLLNYLQVLDLKRMQEAVDFSQLVQLCPNLIRLRCALTGHVEGREAFRRLRSANLRFKFGSTLMSFLTSNQTTETLSIGTLKKVALSDSLVNDLLDLSLDGRVVGKSVKTLSFRYAHLHNIIWYRKLTTIEARGICETS